MTRWSPLCTGAGKFPFRDEDFVRSVPAKADLAASREYWQTLDHDLAETLLASIEQAASRLAFVPEGGGLVNQDITPKWHAVGMPYIAPHPAREITIQILRLHRDRHD